MCVLLCAPLPQVSTRHGHPLHPHSKDEKNSQPFPWKGLAYLRWGVCVWVLFWVAYLRCDIVVGGVGGWVGR